MHTLSESFKDCETLKLKELCPRCNKNLYRKRLKIETTQYRRLRRMGILFKAVDFCIEPDCNYIEQGVLYFDRKNLIFIKVGELDNFISNKVYKNKS